MLHYLKDFPGIQFAKVKAEKSLRLQFSSL